jgi:hypothetical protein
MDPQAVVFGIVEAVCARRIEQGEDFLWIEAGV